MINKKIAVVILGYNSQKYLKSLLQSLIGQSYENVDYYYVDNASQDDSVKIVEKFSNHVQIVKNKKNYGYAGAYARFLKRVFHENYDGAVLLNPDVVVDDGWLENLVMSAFERDDIGAVQSKILLLDDEQNKTQKVGSYGGSLHYLGMGLLGADESVANNDGEVSFISGTSLLVKRDAYLKSGGLDPDYFLYSEDLDLCWRMQLHGYKCVVAQESIVWHHYVFYRIGDSRNKFYYLERNRLFCLWKNYNYKSLFIISPALFVLDIGIVLHSIKNKYFLEKVKANFDFIKNIPVIHRKHCDVQKNRSVSDREFFKSMNKEIEFEELDSTGLRMANKFFVVYYNIVKHLM